MTTVTMAKKVCAWCKLDMGMVPWSSMTRENPPPVTHGICPACEKSVGLPDDGIVKLTMWKKDDTSVSVTTHWFQALLRLDFAVTLPEFKSHTITEAA